MKTADYEQKYTEIIHCSQGHRPVKIGPFWCCVTVCGFMLARSADNFISVDRGWMYEPAIAR